MDVLPPLCISSSRSSISVGLASSNGGAGCSSKTHICPLLYVICRITVRRFLTVKDNMDFNMTTFIILKPLSIKLAAFTISTVTIKGLQMELFLKNFLTFQTSYSSEPLVLSWLDGSKKKDNLILVIKAIILLETGAFFKDNAKYLTKNVIWRSTPAIRSSPIKWPTHCTRTILTTWYSRYFVISSYSAVNPANIYLFKVSYRKLEKGQWRRSEVFIVNFEHISHLFVVFLLTLNK